MIKSIFVKSVKRMWPLSLILLAIGIYKWITNNPDPLAPESLVSFLFGAAILVFTPPVLVTVALYFDKSKE